MILNINFKLKLSNYTLWKCFIYLKWFLNFFSTILHFQFNYHTLPVIPIKTPEKDDQDTIVSLSKKLNILTIKNTIHRLVPCSMKIICFQLVNEDMSFFLIISSEWIIIMIRKRFKGYWWKSNMSLIKWEGTRNYVYTKINGMDVNLIKLKFFDDYLTLINIKAVMTRLRQS